MVQLKNEQGESTEQCLEQVWYRVAQAIAAIEQTEEKQRYWATRFYDVLADLKFVPGGRNLSAGDPERNRPTSRPHDCH